MEVEQKLEKLLLKTARDPDIHSCVMAVESGSGSIKWSGAAGYADESNQVPMTTETPFFIASVTKIFTASATMRLIESGKLALADPAVKFLPASIINGIHVYQGTDYSGKVTIEHLLSHSSGIADYYLDKPKGGESFFDRLQAEPDRSWTVDETIELARDSLEAKFPPGEKVSYSDTNYQILGKILEAVTQKSLQDVFNEFFFKPLEMKETWLFGRSNPHREMEPGVAPFYYGEQVISSSRAYESSWADGGLVSTVHESLIFLKGLKEGAIFDQATTLQRMHQWGSLQFPLKYGYGTMYFKLPRIMTLFRSVPPIWGHSGSIGSFLFYSDDLDLYMAGTLNQGKSQSKPFNIMIDLIRSSQ